MFGEGGKEDFTVMFEEQKIFDSVMFRGSCKQATSDVDVKGLCLLQKVYFTGAHGYFEVTDDITSYCKAELFDTVGKKTPVFVRLSTVGKPYLFSNFIGQIGPS